MKSGNDSTSGTDRYWADRPAVVGCRDDQPESGLAIAVFDRVAEFYEAITKNGMLDLWRRVHAMYFGLSDDGGEHLSSDIQFGGSFDERVYAKANHFRSIVQYLVTVTVSERPEFSPRAINSDPKSMEQVPVARSVLEYYMRETGLERRTKSVMERAILYGRAYMWCSWDPGMGPLWAPTGADGQPTMEEAERAGDIRCRALSPTAVTCDTTREQDDQQWYVVREPASRWDLAARFASGTTDTSRRLREQIMSCDASATESELGGFGNSGFGDDLRTDDIYVYHFYHASTDALPEGRYSILLPGGGVLFDGPLPYDDVPVLAVSPSDLLETGYGYTTTWDLMGLQDMYDAIISTCMTIVDAFGVSTIIAPEGSEISAEELRDGLSLIYYPAGMEKPEALNLGGIREELFKLREILKADMETIPGVNSVARGEPAPSLKSGAALALVQAQALQFNSGLQAAYIQMLEQLGTLLIRVLKRFAKVPRLAMIAGEGETDALKQFVGKDVGAIERVVVDTGNALQRTTAGKIQLAEWLLDKGMIKRPEQLYQVLESGRLDVTYRPDLRQMQCVARENEALKAGKGATVFFTDNPVLHIQEHMDVANSQEARDNPVLMRALGGHVLEHIQVWRDTDPDLLRMLGYPTPDEGMGMPPMKPKAGNEDLPPDMQRGGQPPGSPIQVPGEPPPMPGGPEGSAGPRMPRMPENPMNNVQP